MGTVHRDSDPKPLLWENIEIGREYGPVEGVISDFQVKSHAYAVDDYGDWYFRSSPFGGRIGHPMLLAQDMFSLWRLKYLLVEPVPQGLHARNEVELLRPVFVGQHVTVRGRHVDKYEKRGRGYRIIEGEVVDDAGQVLQRLRGTETMPFESGATVAKAAGGPRSKAITGEVPPGAPVVETAGLYVPEGAVLPSLTKHPTLEQSTLFSGFRFSWAEEATSMITGLHTDPEYARRRGQPDCLVQGLISQIYISELCTNFFGPSWLTSGRSSVAFTRPVVVRDNLSVSGMVRRVVREGERTRIELDVWCKNQQGELVTVGSASAFTK